MGVKLTPLVKGETCELEELSGRVLAIDAYNFFYQFLASIRQPDGTPLMDSKGRVTSAHSGTFYRTANMLKIGIKPVFVFDGEPSPLKKATLEARRKTREEAMEKWMKALREGRIEEARKYAQAAIALDEEMVKDLEKLITALGVPVVHAPSEGEAQSAYMCSRGDVWATASQDYDSLVFGSPRLVRNLAIVGRRKLPGKQVYVKVSPEVFELEKMLKELGIGREQLVALAILVGTDYNPGGVPGIGPKRALSIVRKHKDIDRVFREVKWEFEVDPMEIARIFLEPDVTSNYTLEWKPVDRDRVLRILVDEHDFSFERVSKALDEIEAAVERAKKRRSLEAWFK
ncbi:MAG: flap endonuclease-1 [Thermoproteota archaeon]|nr:MAG: flap endonuclease-1 [Candidatus Korarchaeota archaeon]